MVITKIEDMAEVIDFAFAVRARLEHLEIDVDTHLANTCCHLVKLAGELHKNDVAESEERDEVKRLRAAEMIPAIEIEATGYARILKATAYHQGDFRGRSIYLVWEQELGDRNIDANYTCGVSVPSHI
jgi:hypothetical protein